MVSIYDNHCYKWQQIKRQIELYEPGYEPGAFGFLQSIGKPCVNQDFTFIRIFSAIPWPNKITVYVDDVEVARELQYKQFSYYIPVKKGNHVIRVYSNIAGDDLIMEINNSDIHTNQAVTIAIWKVEESFRTTTLVDDVTQRLYPDRYIFRLANLSQILY